VIRISVLFYNLFRGMIVLAMAVRLDCMPSSSGSFDLHANARPPSISTLLHAHVHPARRSLW